MRHGVQELAGFARQVMQELQQRRSKVFAEFQTASRARQPKADELQGDLQKIANQVEALKQMAAHFDSPEAKAVEEARKASARKGGKASAEARRVGTQEAVPPGPSPTPAEPPPPPQPPPEPAPEAPPPPEEEETLRPAAEGERSAAGDGSPLEEALRAAAG